MEVGKAKWREIWGREKGSGEGKGRKRRRWVVRERKIKE